MKNLLMTVRRRLALSLLAVSLGSFAQAPAPAPGPAPDREQLERRFTAVETLIEKSSAARQIEQSAVPEALARRNVAREFFQKAKAALAAGDLPSASRLLPEASVKMFEAVRLAAPEQVTKGKQLDDLKARAESVRALLAAQQRIATEKKGVAGAAETTALLEKLVKQGEELTAREDINAAREVLDRAYLVAKAAIGSMRSGDTLVRSLTFASKKEEYAYEVDRNDTHKMLLKVTADDERKAARAADAMGRATGLRNEADAAAGRGDYAGAIKLLEDSTRELVRAIRGAGLYIPG